MTLKGQNRDPDMFWTQIPENVLRYRLGYNGTPIGYSPGVSDGHVPDDVASLKRYEGRIPDILGCKYLAHRYR